MSRTAKYSIAFILAFFLLPSLDLMARGFGGGGRGGGGSRGASMSRGGSSMSRGGSSMSRGGSSMSRGGSSMSRGGSSMSRGGSSMSRGGASASRGGASASFGGASASRGGASVSRGGASASRGGISTSGRSAAGQAGGKSVSGPGGGSVTVGGARGGVKGPSGGAAGRVGGVQVEGPGGRTATKGGASGVAKGSSGVAAGQARGGSVSGSRGSISGGQAHASGRSLSTDAGFSKYRGGVSVRGAGGTTAHRTRSVTSVNRHAQGTSVRRSVGFRYNDRGRWYSSGWYARNPNAWRAAGLSTAAIWTAASWNSLRSYWGPTYVAEPIYYDYGNTIVYEGDTVYNGTEPIATSDEYYEEASQIAVAGAAEANDDEEWMSLGVWAMVQGDETESNNIIQLAVNRDGIIRGNHYNALTDKTEPLQGSVDKKSQRAAWTIGENSSVISETGISNLTGDETEMLIHYGKDRTDQWTLVRLEEPDEDTSAG